MLYTAKNTSTDDGAEEEEYEDDSDKTPTNKNPGSWGKRSTGFDAEAGANEGSPVKKPKLKPTIPRSNETVKGSDDDDDDGDSIQFMLL